MLPQGLAVSGAPCSSIRCARSIAPRAGCAIVEAAPQTVVAEVQAKLAALFGIAT